MRSVWVHKGQDFEGDAQQTGSVERCLLDHVQSETIDTSVLSDNSIDNMEIIIENSDLECGNRLVNCQLGGAKQLEDIVGETLKYFEGTQTVCLFDSLISSRIR